MMQNSIRGGFREPVFPLRTASSANYLEKINQICTMSLPTHKLLLSLLFNI
jgi:hypothetical protein